MRDDEAVRAPFHGGDLTPREHGDPQSRQVVGQGAPQHRVVVVARHVEEQTLRRADEVHVEHRDELGARELPRVREEAACEDLERQVACLLGEAEPVQHLGRAHPVQEGVRGREVDVEEPEGRIDVDRGETGEVEAGAPRHEGREVPRRSARDPREGVRTAAVADQGVVGERAKPRQGGVGAAQHGPQVVVLPEERMEAAAHLCLTTVRQCHGPGPHPAAELVGALDDRDADPALGEAQRRGEPRDPTPDDDDVPVRVGIGHLCRRGGRMEDGPAVQAGAPPRPTAARDHHGRDPTTVCTRSRCHPAYDSWWRSTTPAPRRRSQMRPTESKSRTLV